MTDIAGEIKIFALPSENPNFLNNMHKLGWAEADGSSLNQLAYPELFRSIGLAWGSKDPKNSFLLPDLRGTFLRGWGGDATDRTAIGGGSATGSDVGTVQGDSFQGHTHHNPEHIHALANYIGRSDLRSAFNQGGPGPGNSYATDPATVSIEDPIDWKHGSVRISNETRPVNAAVIFFICVGRTFTPHDRLADG